MRTTAGYFFMTKVYQKLPLDVNQLLKKLEAKGLIINSRQDAIQCLSTIGYYRLSAYFIPFQNNNGVEKTFREGTTFENVLQLYSFDKELRLLAIDPIETIEVALRTSITDVMSIKYGAHWYLDQSYFISHNNFAYLIKEVKLISKKRKEVFLKHYFKNYGSPEYPPSWMIMECLSFGTLNLFLKSIKALQDRKEICAVFKHHPTIIESWFTSLYYVRNLCAHHARLWNRWFVMTPIHPHNQPISCTERTFCEQAYIITRMLEAIHEEKAVVWKRKLYHLLESCPSVPKHKMGFLLNWKSDPFWDGLQNG